MTDLTDMLISAKKRKCYSTLEMFLADFITSLSRLGWCKINGDVDCGERWIWVSGAGMFHTKVAVCFALKEYVDVFKRAFDVTIIPVSNFDEKMWSIDPERLNREVPEMQWEVEPEAVNPNCFSIKDLYFVTV